MPRYSIVIPTKNRAYCLWRAIQSVVAQSYQNWELLVVDGGSSDGSEKLVNGFDDGRIRFIRNERDTGVASARNKGIAEAIGEYVAYLDSDDYVYSTWLEEMDQFIEQQPSHVLYMPNKLFTLKRTNQQNQTLTVYSQEKLFGAKAFSAENIAAMAIQCDTNGMIHLKDAVTRTGLWNEELTLYEDFEFLFRFATCFPDGIAFNDKVLVSYTRSYGKDSLCSNATYAQLVACLDKLNELHGEHLRALGQNWYKSLRAKYQRLAETEAMTGKGIAEHVHEKYKHDRVSSGTN